jgi:hypothetical protein
MRRHEARSCRPSAVGRQPSAVGLLLSVIVLLVALPLSARTQQIPYSVGRWEPDSTGNHRAVVRVTADAVSPSGAVGTAWPGDAVRVHVPWRRRDQQPEQKRIVVVAAATGEGVANVVPSPRRGLLLAACPREPGCAPEVLASAPADKPLAGRTGTITTAS